MSFFSHHSQELKNLLPSVAPCPQFTHPGGCHEVCSPQVSSDSFTILELKVALDPDRSGNCAIVDLILDAVVQNNRQEETNSKNKGR